MIHCVYRHFDKEGTLLYVGVSSNIGIRTNQHKSSKWAAMISNITVETFGTRDEALAAEKKAIQNESPLYNVKDLPNKFPRYHIKEPVIPKYENLSRQQKKKFDAIPADTVEKIKGDTRDSYRVASEYKVPTPFVKIIRGRDGEIEIQKIKLRSLLERQKADIERKSVIIRYISQVIEEEI